ncbi:MAG: PAS domain S-box protein [Chlorobi bacterium]|nr:PAS domain S-box protein [Chlorobiota bacterium]
MIHILDADGIIREVNSAWLLKLGYEHDEVIGKHISYFVHDKYKGYIQDVLTKIKISKTPVKQNMVFITKDGSEIIVNENKSPIIFNGELSSIQVILEDITDIEKAKEITNQNMLLNGVNRILNETLESDSLQNVALRALRITEMITGSKFGMIGLLNDKKDSLDILASTHEIFLKTLTKKEASLFKGIPIRGILSKMIRNHESYFTNDYHSEINAVKLPEAHPNLVCILGTPLFIGDKEFGIVIVANSPVGYTNLDKTNLTSIASAISTVLKRKQTDVELRQHKENLEELLDKRTKEIRKLNDSLVEEIKLTEKISKAYIESERRYKRLFENAPIGMYRSNEKGEIILANKKLLEILGYNSVEDLAKNLTAYELYPENENREKFIELIQANGSIQNFQTKLIKKDGEIIDVIENANLLFDEDENMQYYEGIIQDVTQQKKYKELIEILSAAFEQTPALTFITDVDGNIEYVNNAFTNITGYCKTEAIGKNPNILKSGFHDEQFYQQMWKTITSGKAWISEFRDRKKNGEQFWANSIVFPIKNSENKIIRYVAIQEDITEKKKILAELFKAKEEAEKADKLKSEFLAQISHEIRTPLTSMVSFTSLLQSDLENVVDEELAYAFTAIKNSAKRITRTVDLILNVSQLETKTFDFNPSEIEINDHILEDIYLEYFQYCRQKNLEFIFTKEISPFYFWGDEYTLQQIFNNLIDNAVKFTNSGKVEIKTFMDDKKKRIVEISDTGIGISKDYLPRLFEKFTQEEQGYTRRFDGNGLGMVLVKKYCELNNLAVEVESEKGKGTTISVIFPN